MVAKLDSGSGRSGTMWLVELCKKQNVPVMVICTMPFSFDGETIRQLAIDAVNSLDEKGILLKVLYMENLLNMHEDLDLYKYYKHSDKYVADAVASLMLAFLAVITLTI